MKWLTAIYLFILGLIVFLADQREYQPLFRRVREMPYGDKLGHLVLMGLFSFLLNTALECRTLRILKIELLRGSLIVALVVTLEEFSQLFIRYRSFDPVDLLFDYLGIFSFGLLAYHLKRRRRYRAGAHPQL
ncbi:MAG TPA: VanZ family protein [Pyrinomonadaceae bacterium]|jgi:VanZ family protein|nr:VanZ family protein [Pyrinomonadaceae bacterium]